MKTVKTLKKKLALLSAGFCAAMLAFSHNASALTIADNQTLGEISASASFNDSNKTAYVNNMIAMNSNSADGFMGQNFLRSNNDFGPLPTAVLALNGTGTTIPLGTGLYSYLYAKYDIGLNPIVEVWYIGNLSGSVQIPGLSGGLTGWTLFGRGGQGGQGVPDGGTTVMLLGSALGALGMARRFLKA